MVPKDVLQFTCEKGRWPCSRVYNIRAAGSPLASNGNARPSAKKSVSNETSAGGDATIDAVLVVATEA